MVISPSLQLSGSQPQTAPIAEQARQPTISWLALETGHPGAAYATHLVTCVETLLEGEPADVVIVDGPAGTACEAIRTLRRHPIYADRLLLLARDGDELAEALADGHAPTEGSQVEQRWQHWQRRWEQLPAASKHGDPLWRIDRWLLLRPEAWIQPIRNPSDRNHYSYPLLDVLLQQPVADQLTLLEKQWLSGHYERGPLVDRIRSCQECNSSHLNYVDVCSQCRSLEIARQPCLHCFTCGHVNRQQQFRHEDGLRCPNCLTNLRHIGTDYDRPLENYQCQSCHNLFIDAAVEARCLNCGHRHETDELRIREIRPFRLSETARMERWNSQNSSALITQRQSKDSRLLTRDQFADIVNWQLSIHNSSTYAAAYTTLRPALLAIRLIEQADGQSGAHSADQIDRWMESLVAALATSERAMRERDDLIWVLKPHCRPNDIYLFHEYLEKHLQAVHSHDQRPLAIQINGCLLNQNTGMNEDAELLQARLLGEMSEPSTEE